MRGRGDHKETPSPDHLKNPVVDVRYGLGATEHTASAAITRQPNKNMLLLLRYGYFDYRNVTASGHNNYRAHSLYSDLQVRFSSQRVMRLGCVNEKIESFMRLLTFRFFFVYLLAIFIPACDRSDQQIKVYRLVKAAPESVPGDQTAPASSTAVAPQIKWELPEGWAPGAQSPMRYASFMASRENGEKADISVITFPGNGGSDLDNVNRWRQQIGLAPVDTSQLTSLIIPLQSESVSFSTTDLTGTDSRTLAAWLRRDSRSWFFKMTGPNAAVEKEKPKFVRFLQSIRF